MKAVRCPQYGAPEVLQLVEIEKPAPKENEVLVRVCTTTVTAGDTRMRSFNVPPSVWLPARLALGIRKPRMTIPGMELAGEIEAVGKQVTRFKPGDRVFAATSKHGFGAYAEYKCLPEDGLLALQSPGVPCEQAAAIPTGGRTALYFLRAANVQPGQKVLIYGASGSVGTYAVQLATLFGAQVTGVCSTPNLDLVHSLGAQTVIDYTQEDFTQTGETYDVIFDAVGKSSLAASLAALKQDGTLMHAVAVPGVALRIWWSGLGNRRKFVGGGPPKEAEDLRYLQELVETGQIRPVIDRRYLLAQIVEAHRYVDTGRKRGNVVITVGEHTAVARDITAADADSQPSTAELELVGRQA